MPEIAFICPTYNHFVYAHHAIASFFKYSPADSVCLLIDDASPEWEKIDWDAFYQGIPREKVVTLRSKENRGLTHSWNWGLRKARDLGAQFTIAGNSDILFTNGWEEPMVQALKADTNIKMVGPLSNAAGITAKGKQDVARYYPKYKVTDDANYLNIVARFLKRRRPAGEIVPSASGVNGFFQMAATKTWWDNAFDLNNCYRPRNDYNSKGHRNRTPLMTLNEDELQKRWRANNANSGIVTRSFIFHYRAVSRGDRYKKGGWYRLKDKNRPT